MRYRSLLRRRRGYVLVYFAMLAFALMAVATLVVDVGFAILTRRQMLTATDSAALEGLRLRDGVPSQWVPDPANPNQLDPSIVSAMGFAQTDQMQGETLSPTKNDDIRRWAAQQIVGDTFDDNLNTADGDPSTATPYQGGPANFGAGPVVNFTDSPDVSPGGQAIAASQTLTLGSPTVYKPYVAKNPSGQTWQFQINPDNAQAGDMVSGNYSYDLSNYGPSATAVEDDAYNRSDFSQPGNTSPNSFLVRMKRTKNEPPNNAPISSSGPALPYLFGRGTLLQTQRTSSGTVWAKSQGIAVRATSIADAKPALATGMPQLFSTNANGTTTGLSGVAPFGVSLSYFSNLISANSGSTRLSETMTVGSTGSLTSTTHPVGNAPDGQLMSVASQGWSVTRIGLLVDQFAASSVSHSSAQSFYRYLPIYDNSFDPNRQRWIIGFLSISNVSIAPSGSSIGFSYTPGVTTSPIAAPGVIGYENTSALFLRDRDDATDPSGYSTLLPLIFQANQRLIATSQNGQAVAAPTAPYVVGAPALVRSE